MIRLISVVILFSTSLSGYANDKFLPLPDSLIPLTTNEGRQLLKESGSIDEYIRLSMNFETQENLGYCGVASSVIVLNSLKGQRPISPEHRPYTLFTQENFFADNVASVKTPERVKTSGMTLDQLSEMLSHAGLNSKVVHAVDGGLPSFREAVRKSMAEDSSHILVNYLRKTIGQESGGHISPVAGYHESSDQFLILDVSRYKYPPVWVKGSDLWNAMLAVDGEVQLSRGYVTVSTKKR